MFIPRLRFKFLTNAADNDEEHTLHLDRSYPGANMMRRFTMQIAVQYLLNSDFRFPFPIKFRFIDFALMHLPLKKEKKLRSISSCLPTRSLPVFFKLNRASHTKSLAVCQTCKSYTVQTTPHYYPQRCHISFLLRMSCSILVFHNCFTRSKNHTY